MISTTLNFKIYVLDLTKLLNDSESTMLFFLNKLLFPYLFSEWELPSNHKRDRFRQHSSGLAAELCKIGLFLLPVHFFNAWCQQNTNYLYSLVEWI